MLISLFLLVCKCMYTICARIKNYRIHMSQRLIESKRRRPVFDMILLSGISAPFPFQNAMPRLVERKLVFPTPHLFIRSPSLPLGLGPTKAEIWSPLKARSRPCLCTRQTRPQFRWIRGYGRLGKPDARGYVYIYIYILCVQPPAPPQKKKEKETSKRKKNKENQATFLLPLQPPNIPLCCPLSSQYLISRSLWFSQCSPSSSLFP